FDLFRLGPVLSLAGHGPADDFRQERQQALDDAFAALQGKRPRSEKVLLGEVVEELTSPHLRDRHPLVIDHAALLRAGFDSQTSTTLVGGRPVADQAEEPSLPWQDENLAVLISPSAVLLTTRAEEQRWGQDVPDAIDAALALAVQRGQDPSGR